MVAKNRILSVGLTAIGLFGSAAARAGDPPPASTTVAPKAHSVVLFSNGSILQGEISEQGNDVVIRQRGGAIRRPKGQVIGCFASVAEVYEYKSAQIPDGDPDERLKLARWCLTVNLQAEAKLEIRKVIAVSPRSLEAKAMLVAIEADETRHAGPQIDSQVARTSAEMPAAEPVNPAVLQRAERELGISGAPVIFDLPPSLAVKRAQTFASAVHPVLQASCVKCHNETSDRTFQLIEVKKGKRVSGDALRANLDATLLLVDRDNLAKSDLLSIALIPHGNVSNKRPIFTGSNDKRFQILEAWVNSLQTRPSPLGVASTPRRPATRENAGPSPATGFATERTPVPLPFTPTPSAAAIPTPMPDLYGRDVDPAMRQTKLIPPTTYVPGRGLVPDLETPSEKDFPVPFAVSGKVPASKPAATDGPPAAKPAAGTRPTPGPSAGVLPPLPGPADSASKPAAKPKKAVKIDRSQLEKALINRNSGTPGTGP